MKVIIVGYGRMGKEVEQILLSRNHTIAARIDPFGGDFPILTEDVAAKADMAIEFSLADAVTANSQIYANTGCSIIMGTTGWLDKIDDVKKIAGAGRIGFLYGSNFSIGAHIFFKLIAMAARLINPVPEYDIMGYEIHHKKKKDSPSGTALSIAKVILENNKKKDTLVTDRLDRAINENELHFASLRGGDIPGIHKVILDSAADTIEISHSARSRSGLALGAVIAAEWLKDKKGFFTVEDFIAEIFK
jgi:4-hydroxy-tetrahydrodipicolinate reductase